ncbi:hypothetical protein BDK51DRAFT_29332 [Blyttiomyces helicus]|uniref:Uncharacterized protein n=1 Tax=Blyttiomyces helicus TaxID=388810 RepID=A0A4P9WLZ2_9FUNG|nr:hypothetical protein BDK51DRAFT_29332 [Blyttiomyces helicus]|eukprot:RKO92170.1 hypothetical protein BDK51DRAFT_29332 [Blyttiomyces helicus]
MGGGRKYPPPPARDPFTPEREIGSLVHQAGLIGDAKGEYAAARQLAAQGAGEEGIRSVQGYTSDWADHFKKQKPTRGRKNVWKPRRVKETKSAEEAAVKAKRKEGEGETKRTRGMEEESEGEKKAAAANPKPKRRKKTAVGGNAEIGEGVESTAGETTVNASRPAQKKPWISGEGLMAELVDQMNVEQ